jgi:hypothetical protein
MDNVVVNDSNITIKHPLTWTLSMSLLS